MVPTDMPRPAVSLPTLLRGLHFWHRRQIASPQPSWPAAARAAVSWGHQHHQLQTCRAAAASAAAAQQQAAPDAVPAPQAEQQQSTPRASTPHHQTVDYTTLLASAHDLRQTLCPSKVEQALQVEDDAVVLKLRTLDSTAWLRLSWHPITGHMGLAGSGGSGGNPPERTGAAAEAYAFGGQLQSALRGLVLSGVELPAAWERVVQLQFATRPTDPPTHTLHCEQMGRYSNLILTDSSGTVMAAGHQVGGKQSSLRQVQAGRQYALPPPAPGIDPDSCPTLEDWQRTVQLAAAKKQQGAAGSKAGAAGGAAGSKAGAAAGAAGGSVVDGCVRAFRGASPCLVRELCRAAGVDPTTPAANLAEPQWAALHAQWQRWLGSVAERSFQPSSCAHGGGYSVLGGYPRPEESVLGMLGRYYSRVHATEQFAQMKGRLERIVSQAMQRLQKKIESLKKQGGQSDKHLQTQKLADLLMANIHRCTPGAASIEAEDWDAPGSLVTIQLDPLKSAVECAEELYRQARKQRRAVDQVAPLVAEAESQLEYLQEVELMLSQLEEAGGEWEETGGRGDWAALREVQAELVSGGYMKPPPEAALAAKAASKARRAQKRAAGGAGGNGSGSGSGGQGYREYTSPGGLLVLVGRNSRQNDELTMRAANSQDVWMHARGVPGAHVLLRVPPGGAPGDADVQFAADLAVWFSKARTQGKADVTCACPDDICKPKGAKPGQVLVLKESVVVGRPHQSAAALAGEE